MYFPQVHRTNEKLQSTLYSTLRSLCINGIKIKWFFFLSSIAYFFMYFYFFFNLIERIQKHYFYCVLRKCRCCTRRVFNSRTIHEKKKKLTTVKQSRGREMFKNTDDDRKVDRIEQNVSFRFRDCIERFGCVIHHESPSGRK